MTRKKSPTAPSVIRALDLGSVSAEYDNQLQEYYVSSWHSYEKARAFNNKNFFLHGRTGSGKSAVLQQIRLSNQFQGDVVVVDIHPDEFFLTMHQHLAEIGELASVTHHKEFAYKILWSLVIASECLREITMRGKNAETKTPRIAHNIAYQFMKDGGLLNKIDLKFSDKVISLLRRIKPALSVKLSKVEVNAELLEPSANPSSREVHRIVRDCHDILESVIPEILGHRQMYILIDDLDLGWTNDEMSNLLLRSLAHVLLRCARINALIKPLVAIRTNIFREIGLYQTEKISDYVIDCYWTKKDLYDVICRRLAFAYRVPAETVWTRFFDERISTKYEKKMDTFDYLYRLTLGRPRDMIILVSECLKSAEREMHRKVTKDDVEEATARFSGDRAQALIEEWRFNYPNLGEVLKLFARRDGSDGLKVSYSYEDLWDLLADGHARFWNRNDVNWFIALIDGADVTHLIKTLFMIGVVGIKVSPRNPIVWSHEADPSTLQPDLKSTFYVTPCFLPYLETLLSSL